jgi:hypothetical protein
MCRYKRERLQEASLHRLWGHDTPLLGTAARKFYTSGRREGLCTAHFV